MFQFNNSHPIRFVMRMALTLMMMTTGLTSVAGAVESDAGLLAQGKVQMTDTGSYCDLKRPGKKHKKGEHKKERQNRLNLTDDQKTEMKAIRTAFREAHQDELQKKRCAMQALREQKKNGAISGEEFKTQKEALKQQYAGLHDAKESMKNQLKAILTPEQVEQWDQMKAEHQARKAQRKQDRQEKRRQKKESQQPQ